MISKSRIPLSASVEELFIQKVKNPPKVTVEEKSNNKK